MNAAMRVIPIKVETGGAAAAAEHAHVRLQRAGFMRMMLIGEPRLSEFVKAYRTLGYEVETLPYRDEATGEAVRDCATIYIRRKGDGLTG
jgi:hypothetical protein